MRIALIAWLIGWAVFSLPWTTFSLRPEPERIDWVPFARTRAKDQVRNLGYYVPLGALGVGLGVAPAAVTGAGAALSLTTETLQIFSSDRFPSTTDLILNTIGTLFGAGLAQAARRRRRAAPVLRER